MDSISPGSMTLPELQEELTSRGIDMKGNKNQLAERLIAAIAEGNVNEHAGNNGASNGGGVEEEAEWGEPGDDVTAGGAAPPPGKADLPTVMVGNLPQFKNFRQFNDHLKTFLEVDPVRVKLVKRPRHCFAFVVFLTEEKYAAAFAQMEGHTWAGRRWWVKRAVPNPHPQKRAQGDQPGGEVGAEDGAPQGKRRRTDDQDETLTPLQRIEKLLTPMAHEPYEEQLRQKQQMAHGFLRKLARRLNMEVPEEDADWLPCPCLPILPCPVVKGYRSRIEFIVGVDGEGTEKCVGNRWLNQTSRKVIVVSPHELKLLPVSVKAIVCAAQTYLQTESPLAAFDEGTKEGHWRTVKVRVSDDGQALVTFCLQQQELTEEQIDEEKARLSACFETGAGSDAGVASLTVTAYRDNTNKFIGRRGMHQAYTDHPVFGDQALTEELMDLKVRVSRKSFLTGVNALAAEALIEKLHELVAVGKSSLVLDICCGVGTIGLSLASRCKTVVGMDASSDAIADAEFNAQQNGIDNVEFHHGKPEKVLPNFLPQLHTALTNGEYAEVVGIIDPPRGWVSREVVLSLRRWNFVTKLVYVSRDLDKSLFNLEGLTRSIERIQGGPFSLTKVLPFDPAPHTKRVGLALVLERPRESIASYLPPVIARMLAK